MDPVYLNALVLCALCMAGLLRALGLGEYRCSYCGARSARGHADTCPWRSSPSG